MGQMFIVRISTSVLPTALLRYDGASQNFSMQDLIVRAASFYDGPEATTEIPHDMI